MNHHSHFTSRLTVEMLFSVKYEQLMKKNIRQFEQAPDELKTENLKQKTTL